VLLAAVALYNFRNYAELALGLDEPLALLVGGNAQGKTNLLEGICLAALTRSPRGSPAAELIRHGMTAARVTLRLQDDDRHDTVEARLQRSEADARVTREFRVNERPVAAHAAVGRLRVVLFWPEDLGVVKGGGEGRRRLLNDLLRQVDRRFARQLSQYERILDQRNALLRQVRDGLQPAQALAYWTQELAGAAAPVVRARVAHLRRFAPLVEGEHRRLSGEAEALEVAYQPKRYAGGDELVGVDDGALSAQIVRALEEAAPEELARGMTVVGPHHDDLLFQVGGRPARVFASQGQQRSIMLSWRLAEVAYIAGQTGSLPLLLLDDVLSELDAARRAALLGAVERAGQAVLTACEESDLPEGWLRRLPRYRVESGSVRRDA